jgi:hypothetical protein
MKTIVTGVTGKETAKMLTQVGLWELVAINGGRMCTSSLNQYESAVRYIFSGGVSPYPYSSFGTPSCWPAGYGFGP